MYHYIHLSTSFLPWLVPGSATREWRTKSFGEWVVFDLQLSYLQEIKKDYVNMWTHTCMHAHTHACTHTCMHTYVASAEGKLTLSFWYAVTVVNRVPGNRKVLKLSQSRLLMSSDSTTCRRGWYLCMLFTMIYRWKKKSVIMCVYPPSPPLPLLPSPPSPPYLLPSLSYPYLYSARTQVCVDRNPYKCVGSLRKNPQQTVIELPQQLVW